MSHWERRGRAGWLVLGMITLALAGGPARAIMPPLSDYKFDDGEVELAVKVPQDWNVERLDHGLRMQRDAHQDLFGSALLGFYEYAKAPSPDKFLDGALAAWSEQFDNWQVLAKSAPPERPRVRLASVSFRRLGFPCRGYVMAVIGKETGTIGFCYAETVQAKELHLDDLVQLLVAGTYEAFPVRSGESTTDSDAQQAVDQAIQKLYGDAAADFEEVWQEFAGEGQLDAGLLGTCGTFQPALRQLKLFLSGFLAERPKERVQDLAVYCIPATDFNAFALGRNEKGPGFLAFHARLALAFAALAQEYTSLRNQGLEHDALGARLTDYSGRLAAAVIRNEALPEPEDLDFSKDSNLQRFEKVFDGMIGLVMCHEMAHYYLRHSESGEDGTAFSVQQREVAADSAALAHIQRAADQSHDVWEGGAIHAFGFLATIDNVAGEGGAEPEWTRSHPYGATRLSMATATLGEDNFAFRNDPWNGGAQLEHGSGGVQVVGGLTRPGGTDQPVVAFTHPQSQVDFTFPDGWIAQFDAESNVLQMTRRGMDGLPMAIYSCGGEYASAKAICDEVFGELKKSAKGFQQTSDENLNTPNEKLKVHVGIAQGKFPAGQLALVCLGIQSPGWNHAIMLMTPSERLEQDLADFEKIIDQMRFVTGE